MPVKLSGLNRPPRALVLGRPGTGKTRLVGTLVKAIPETLVVVTRPEGLDTLQSMGVDPDVELLTDWRDIWDFYAKLVASTSKYKALAVDDLSFIQGVGRQRIEARPASANEARLADQNKAQFQAQVLREQLMGTRTLRDYRAWGELSLSLTTFITAVLALPFQFQLWTVHEEVRTDPHTKTEHVYADLQGELRATITAYFSFVADMLKLTVSDNPGVHYVMSSLSHPFTEAKDRWLEGGRIWVNPKAQDILDHHDKPEKGKEEILEKKIKEVILGIIPARRE